jgi:hypothetical protein
MRTQYRSVAEAEAWARSLGSVVDYGERLDLANLCNELLAQLIERRLYLPDQILVDALLFRRYRRKSVQIPTFSEEGVLSINPIAWIWEDVVGTTALLYQSGQWSTDSPLHCLNHEAGHIVHYKADPVHYNQLRDTDLTLNEKNFVARKVSEYSRESPYEFLSEVFAVLLNGKPLDAFGKRIANLYRRWGGIEP